MSGVSIWDESWYLLPLLDTSEWKTDHIRRSQGLEVSDIQTKRSLPNSEAGRPVNNPLSHLQKQSLHRRYILISICAPVEAME